MNKSFAVFAAIAAWTMFGTASAAAEPLPSVRLVCSFDYDGMLAKLSQQPLLASLNKDQVGSPIVLRVIHSVVPTTSGGAAGFASAILAGGSLGILPVVENKDLVITYDLFVNQTMIATYAYQKNFTRAFNIYSKDKTKGLGEEGQTWAESTVDLFAADIAKNPKVLNLVAEYRYYFGASTTPSASK